MNTIDYQYLTVLTPQSLDSLLPLEIIDETSAVRSAFVERYGIHHLSSVWEESCGFYILFSHIRPDNSFDVYVGKATNGFYNRLRRHDKDKDWWRTALLVVRDNTSGFSSTQSSYMEGLMRKILDSSTHVTVHNIAATGDKTLPKWEEPAMEAIALSVLRIMFLRGYRNASMARIAEDLTEKIDNSNQDVQSTEARGEDVLELSDLRSEQDRAMVPLSLLGSSPKNEKEEMFQTLRSWRLSVAKEKGFSAFIVFPDKTLWNIIEKHPKNMDDLLQIAGVSGKKAIDYGEAVLAILNP